MLRDYRQEKVDGILAEGRAQMRRRRKTMMNQGMFNRLDPSAKGLGSISSKFKSHNYIEEGDSKESE